MGVPTFDERRAPYRKGTTRVNPAWVDQATYWSADGSRHVTFQEARVAESDSPCQYRSARGSKLCGQRSAHKHIKRTPKGVDTTGFLPKVHEPIPQNEGAAQEEAAALTDIWVVPEGPKTADAISAAGVRAISAGDKNGYRRCDLSMLKDQHMVYWPDNDVDVEKTAAATEIAIRKVGPASIRRALPVPNERLLGRKPAGADAANLPDGHSIRQWVLDTIKNQPDSAAETGNSNVAIRRPDWAGIGEAAVQILPLRYRYVPDSDMWYRWTGCKWKFASTAPKEIVDAIEANRYDIANKMSISGYSEHATILIRRSPNGAVSKSDLVQQFRNAYRGTRPVPPLAGAVATPEGVVDIKTGVVVRHDWQRHDTTAVTNGPLSSTGR